ncbi:cyclic nucleotide-binding domain-containing protein 1 [Fukomys damarensis]|uniref:cyclic nucleotide-binding domain-containing protein 1 n=1 Tax=Fukomys damarensis TaxID=885580 RepID=UPI001455B15B|nr:cyclic nucleotide-binding domain-containing protein 1 [Fukomys damarensis]
MPLSTLPSAIFSQMTATSNVPPPPLRSIPSLKMSKQINYGQLDALCHIRSIHHSWSSCTAVSAHSAFIKQYPKIFLHKKTRLPKIFKQEPKRKPSEAKEGSQNQPEDSHNIAVHIKKAHGGYASYGQKGSPETFEEFLHILKKLPVNRTTHEHNIVWKTLKTVPDLASQLNDDHLKTLSKNIISETWVKGSIVFGNDGFYVILKGLARPYTGLCENLTEESDLTASIIPQISVVFDEGLKTYPTAEIFLPPHDLMLRQWSTFGSLEETPDVKLETRLLSVVAEDDCEILKIPAKDYAKLKLEKAKLENIHKMKLICNCPYYEEWPTLSICELTALIKWKKFPAGHVIVESGNVISFVAYINYGYCKIYRSIIGLVKLPSNKIKKTRKLVYVGKLKEKESFGEISVLLQVPFTYTIVAGKDVEMAIIEDKDIFELDEVTQKLMLQTAKPTFEHLTDEDVKNEYLQKEQQKEWKDFKILVSQ